MPKTSSSSLPDPDQLTDQMTADQSATELVVSDQSSPHDQLSEPPPLLGSWPRLYGLVIVNLLVLISLFYLLTKVYS